MSRFVQVIEYRTSRIDEVRALGEKVRIERSGDPGGPLRVTVTKDRDSSDRYLTIVEFESYEKAMENSDHPATQAFAAQLAELVDGAPTFHNLEVLDSWES